MRFFVELAYDGTAYHGWQAQPNALGVQAVIDEALSLILRQTVRTVGAGRTDTGVHAAMMVAHFDLTEWPEGTSEKQLAEKLNRMLPPDIAIKRIYPVPDNMHARFSAVSRTYHYSVTTHKDPFTRHYSLQLPSMPDFAAMNRAAALLLKAEDFTSFCKLHSNNKTNRCHVVKAGWKEGIDGCLYFEIEANRFLRDMVRAIVGTLLEVGRGRLDTEGFARIIAQKDRSAAGNSAPAHALSLVHIAY